MKRNRDAEGEKIWEDVWVNTTCGMCYGGCAIRVRRVNGIPVKIEGMPGATMGSAGGVCGKGAAGLMYYHDPNRVKKPLRRTNPEKGLGVDPKWKEISWEEALSEIAVRMKKLMDENPEKILLSNQTQRASDGPHQQVYLFSQALGQQDNGNYIVGGSSLHCGNAAHMMGGLIHAAWSIAPDWKHTKYVLKWGSSKGTGSGHSPMTNARLRAEAIERGVKEVVFDPMCNFAGGKATEWIQIQPGSDSAVALAMCNYIVHERKVYDVRYLKAKTNFPYLIGDDGLYIREKETGKPLIYDERSGTIKPYDAPDVGDDDYALEGEFELYGRRARPAFMALKEHLKQFEIPWAAKISGIPAETIRRVADEWVDNAQIGSTITIQGKTFPYRPVAAVTFRGAQGHSNGIHQVAAIDLLNELVGGNDVPGGTMGWPSIRRKYPGGQYERVSRIGPDGVIIPAIFYCHTPWPPHKPKVPCKTPGCIDFWPSATISPVHYFTDRDEVWEKLGMKVKPEMVFGLSSNFLISNADWDTAFENFKDCFVALIDIWSNETSEAIGDIILPDVSYLEKDAWSAGIDSYFFSQSPSEEDWWYQVQQPVAKPVGETRFYMDIYLDLADRIGVGDKYRQILIEYYSVADPNLQVESGEKLDWHGMGERVLPWVYGDDWKKVTERGYATWPKQIEDVYWRWHTKSRIPVYMEFLIDARNEIKKICEESGLELDWAQYTPLPSWFPPASMKETDAEYDLVGFSYRDVLHTNNSTFQNPILTEISTMCPYTFTITMNPATAARKGLQDKDVVWLENKYGKKEKGMLKLMEGQHPRTLGIAGQAGLWAKGRPIAKGKGSNFCKLLPSYMKHYDPVSGNIETSVALKVYKAG